MGSTVSWNSRSGLWEATDVNGIWFRYQSFENMIRDLDHCLSPQPLSRQSRIRGPTNFRPHGSRYLSFHELLVAGHVGPTCLREEVSTAIRV